jgi:hypothetical protein
VIEEDSPEYLAVKLETGQRLVLPKKPAEN